MDTWASETDFETWQPALAALQALGIPKADVHVRRQYVRAPGEREFTWAADAQIEIRSPQFWAKNEAERIHLDEQARRALSRTSLPTGFAIAWRRPISPDWSKAWLAALDMLMRDHKRRRIGVAAYERATNELYALHDRVSEQGEDHRQLLAAADAVLEKARRHPAPPNELPPLGRDRISVSEATHLLRAIANGSIKPRVTSPCRTWKDVHHTIGRFEAAGWTVDAFKRSDGMKYVDRIVAPDGRTGDYELFHAREGDPFCLLENDEQDRLCDVLEAI